MTILRAPWRMPQQTCDAKNSHSNAAIIILEQACSKTPYQTSNDPRPGQTNAKKCQKLRV
jgi:hypothetical protein